MSSLLDENSYSIAAYLRVTSLAVALYDFLVTLPSSWRFYRSQWEAPRLNVSFILFFLIQFTSILTLTVSNVGFFYSHFTDQSCARFYLVPSIFKVLQSSVSQTILGVRAFNLSRRSRKLGLCLALLYSVSCALEWSTTLYKRQPVRDPTFRNCRGVFQIRVLGAWIYYVVAIVYDLAVTTISVVYLLRHKISSSSVFSRIFKMMLYDGIGYFTALTAVNVLNLVIYRAGQDIQTAAASLGYCVTWIMSQRLLIHLHEASLERRNETIDATVTLSQSIRSARDVSRAVRSPFEVKSRMVSLDLTIPDFDLDTLESGPDWPEEVNVQVRIEKTVKVERRPRAIYELENYSNHSNSVARHDPISSVVRSRY